ncbi:Protein kinase-like domain [Pseudocohnilembus persalinus]|uniref:Protein kinase-like domain n=1 Tax=Pseudocohnilembus persalinus TaxID=266149 RepID=A0A0V0QHQ4_PSEPJ|nr:Protein kinase-like domain [Pseudocohnilembus persalinus]|eukprot:KRX01568.1 Protein kinase-like domain [Pseudocohnilembus persalinus]
MTDDENKKTQNHLDQFSQFNPITNNQQSQQSFLKISSMNFDLQSYNTHNFLKNFNEPLTDIKEQEQQQQQLNSNSSGNRKKSSKMKIKFSSVQEEENNDKQDDEKNKDKNDLNQQDKNQNNQKNEIDSENIQMMFDQNNDKTIGLNINTFGQGEKFTNTENNINQDKSKYQITDGENENKQAELRKNILNNNDNQNQKNLYELNEKSLISEGSRSYNTSTIDYIQNKEGAEFYKNYEKIRKIGRGGFGEVYEVISKKQNNVKRAVKEIEKNI